MKHIGTVLIAILLFTPQPVRALELRYPSFLPLEEDIALNQLASILLNASLLLGTLLAFVLLTYAGFQYIISGDSSERRSDSRKRLISALIGFAIILTSVLGLRAINPNLITLPDIELPAISSAPLPTPPPKPDPGFIEGQRFGLIDVEGRIADNVDFSSQIESLLPKILEELPALAEQCSSDLCLAGESTYSNYLGEESCRCQTETVCLIEAPNECVEVETCDSCPVCAPATCTGSFCTGDPFPQRENLDTRIEKTSTAFTALISTSGLIASRQGQARNCSLGTEGDLLSCTTARTLGVAGASSCTPTEDYFCSSRGKSLPIHVPLQDWIDDARALAVALDGLADTSQSGDCSLTTFTCPQSGFCSGGQGGGVCSDKAPAVGGCPARLQEYAQEMERFAAGLHERANSLEGLLQGVLLAEEIIAESGSRVAILSCTEARVLVETITSSSTERYRDGTCLEGTNCCPSLQTQQLVSACQDLNLFTCS